MYVLSFCIQRYGENKNTQRLVSEHKQVTHDSPAWCNEKVYLRHILDSTATITEMKLITYITFNCLL